MAYSSDYTGDIVVIYEEDAEEWALYLKSIFQHILLEDRILLYNLQSASIHHLELQSVCDYKCKLLILSSGLLNNLNLKKRYFLDKILHPPENVVVLLCGVENSAILYKILDIDPSNPVMTTNEDPEIYLEVIAGIIQQDSHDTLSSDLENGLKLEDVNVETELITGTLEMPAVLVLPTRISCENPGEIFILLRDEVPDDSLMIEFITGNQWLWTQPDLWNQKVWCMKALDFPAGFVNVNVYCEGVIKATTQIEYYTAAEEIECILQKVADPIGFVCQASKFSSAEKVDNVLTLLLKSPAMYPDFSDSLCKDAEHHQKTDLHLEELPTLLHCAAKFGLKKLAALLLQRPEAIQACRITNTYGENPAHIAEKYDHKEIQKIIKELTVNEDNNASDDQKEDEEEAEDDTYVMMMSSELQCNGHPSRTSTGKQPRAYWKIQKVEGMKDEAKQKEEEEGGGAEEEEKEAKYILEETPCHLGSKAKSIYVMAAEERPPIPPRNQPTTIRQDELFYLSPAWESEKDEKESRNTHGHQKEEYKTEQVGEEDPYTSALVDDGLYDTILANVKKERRKEGRSFIMNRPPAPAPRPLSVPLKEESTPYIAQVFQKKATGMHADNEKLVYPVKKTDRVYSEGITYTTVKPSIPPGQEELIFLQEQVKIGAISMDKALEKFKQWQNHRSGLEAIQQEKIRQLRDSIIRKRPEEESMYDKITIVHHPNVSVKRGSDNLSTEGVVYSSPFRKQTLL